MVQNTLATKQQIFKSVLINKNLKTAQLFLYRVILACHDEQNGSQQKFYDHISLSCGKFNRTKYVERADEEDRLSFKLVMASGFFRMRQTVVPFIVGIKW